MGSTEISAQLDPEDWRELVADYHRLAAASIARFDGCVAKYLGDGVMAYFGWPVAHDNDAERAVRAGLAIVDGLGELNRRQVANRPRMSVRVGVDSGTVVIGHGGGSASEIFGDTPNIASRVQSAAHPDTVVVSPAVHHLVAGLFVAETCGLQQLKGIAQPMELHRIVRLSGARSRLAASAARGLTPFVGRGDELDLIWQLWERASEGQGQVVLISGEAGIGKSRLVHQLRERLKQTPHIWNECVGASHFQNTPFFPISEMIERNLCRYGETDEEKLNQLEADLELAGLKPDEVAPLIAHLLNIGSSDITTPALSPRQQRSRLLSTLVEWTFSATGEQPLILAAEDLHWFDASSLELMELLAERAATNRALLILTARPEFRAPWKPHPHHTQLTLNRMAADDVRRLVEQVVAARALSGDAIEQVIERTGGVPLFVEELTRTVLERGAAQATEREIPATLHDSDGAARSSRPRERGGTGRLRDWPEFSYELLNMIFPASEEHLQAALMSLTVAELIDAQGLPPEAIYGFRHALIQDAAYEALLKSRRRQLHRQVATALTDRFSAIVETQPEVLARH